MSGIVSKNAGRASGIVGAGDIGTDAVDGSNIADDAINSEHYADGSIDNAHIADDAIDSEHYADGSIDNAHIADDAIDSEHYADGSIDNAHIADDAIDSEHYAAGSIDEAHIADNAVTLAKMAGGTDGQIITYDASGDPVAVGPGTDGQVLTSTGAGSPPAFEAAGGGDYVLLYTHNASAATWTFNSSTGVAIATYGAYVFVLSTVFNVSNDARLQIEVSDDDGSTWESAGYQYWNQSIDQDGTVETHLSTSDSEIQVTTGGFRSATAQGGLTGTIFAPHNGSESGKSFMTWMVSCQMNSGYDYMTTWGGGEYNAGVFDAGGADAWRFSVSSGNISGTMKMYGYK